MVAASAWLVAGVLGLAKPRPPGDAVEADSAVRSALSKGDYPWYDPKSDGVKPVWPPGIETLEWLERRFGWLERLHLPGLGKVSIGELIVIGLVLLGLTAVIVALVEAWRRHRPAPEAPGSRTGRRGHDARVVGLPAGVLPGTDDPWAEALRCRERGDYARAVICLFAHQLLTLDRLRVLRLIPGRTARQLVRAIDDRPLRRRVEPTLRLFEAVYYGHRLPSADAFEAVWSDALAFERLVSGGPAS